MKGDTTMQGYMTARQAAKYLGYGINYISYLCSKGKLPGAKKFGNLMWAIPEKSVYDYEPGLQGFALLYKRKRDKEQAEREAKLIEMNAAIQEAKTRRRETE